MKYWWAAFNARPLGMPVPPNWFGLAAVGLLGAFIHPGLWLVGAGLELAYLKLLSGHPRFRKVVDAGDGDAAPVVDPAEARYDEFVAQLGYPEKRRHQDIERRASEILATLKRTPLLESHSDSVEQLVWLHLRLLVAQASIGRVIETASRERAQLADQETQIATRLAKPDISPELKRSLEQQQHVIDQRQQAHADAALRLEQVEAELVRIDHQIALIREQALLAADDGAVGASLNALTTSFNETHRWLDSQRDLLGVFESSTPQRLPDRVRQSARKPPPLSTGASP
ncbi:MAG TPA: hypothetical protein VN581_01410 [Patescibacteria group bacterium]|nr:hypothetical protein [Patescibacteria group bacterium]